MDSKCFQAPLNECKSQAWVLKKVLTLCAREGSQAPRAFPDDRQKKKKKKKHPHITISTFNCGGSTYLRGSTHV